MIKKLKGSTTGKHEINSVTAYINGVRETFYNREIIVENKDYFISI